jgi:pimeloyl-ACP methyl ester carboxylesterase
MVPHDMDHPSVPLLEEAGQAAESFEGSKAIVWGDKDPVLGKLRRRVTRQLPDAEVTVTDAGHFLQEEVPAEIAAAIRWVTSP